MEDLSARILELALQGFECSQIMGRIALEADGNENPDLIRALGGLTKGLGGCQNVCGALTGGCCILGYFTARGEVEEMEHSHSQEMIQLFVCWFEDTYGSCRCDELLRGAFSQTMVICAPMVEACLYKIFEILSDYDIWQ